MPLSAEDKIKWIEEKQTQAEQDMLVFINTFLFTFDPRVQPNPNLPFKLFDYQVSLALDVKDAIEKGYDIFVDKSRDVGATYTVLAVLLWFWRYVDGSNFLLGSRKEDLVDNRFGNKDPESTSNKEESLFGKLDYFIKHLSRLMLPKGFDFKKHNGYMKLLNPETGNVFAGESSNPDFSRGGRFKAILLDEFAFWDNDVSAWGSTADTTNCRIVLTTPGIRPGKAKRLRFGKDGEKIKVIEIDYKKDPRKTAAWESRERARRSTEDWAREIGRNWETAVKGRVYEEIMDAAELGEFPYNPDWSLYVSWDFGLDGTAIGFTQKNPNNGKMRRVASFFKSDKPIQYFFPLFGEPIDSTFEYSNEELRVINTVKIFKKAIHFGDPDVSKRAYQDKNTVSTRQALQGIGIYVQTKPDANTYQIRRDATKVMIQKGYEINKTPENEYYLECLQSARYPQRTENSQSTTAVAEPIHDWTSHHRTETEYLAVNIYEIIVPQETEQPAWAKKENTPPWAGGTGGKTVLGEG